MKKYKKRYRNKRKIGSKKQIQPEIETRIKITSLIKSKSPSSFVLSADKKTIYFTNSFYDAADNFKQKGETYSFSINAATIAADKPFINRLFGGGLAIDSQSGYLYAGLIPSLKQAGFVFRYKTDGVLLDSVKAEIGPSKFYFNYNMEKHAPEVSPR